MQQYVKNYLEAMGFDEGDFIPCEVCEKEAVDIHHITPRSLQGSDEAENLIGLCREDHDKAACGKLTKDFLYWIVKKRGRNEYKNSMV